jgi:hypothetical protein
MRRRVLLIDGVVESEKPFDMDIAIAGLARRVGR